ncbi:MAG: hypothetical protein QGF90_03625 [Gammaproteobacteria bacterium]|nr:hypothetical protein [Gammaproteobacteria bacterium]
MNTSVSSYISTWACTSACFEGIPTSSSLRTNFKVSKVVIAIIVPVKRVVFGKYSQPTQKSAGIPAKKGRSAQQMTGDAKNAMLCHKEGA